MERLYLVSVGQDLARAREERGMSVEDVSTVTRIRSTLIRAIENDDFAPCGGNVYARGHLRSIARAIGIDPEPLIAEFDRAHVEEPVHVAAVAAQPAEPDIAARAERKRPNWSAAMAAALVAIIVLAAYGLIHNNNPSHTTAQTSPPAPVQSSTPTPSRAPATPPPSAVAQVPTTGATALVRVTNGRTWLQAETLAGRLLFQGLLNPGQSKVFRDPKGLRLVIGNAPAVELVADNHDFGTPQSSGNVAHVTIQPGGDVQFA